MEKREISSNHVRNMATLLHHSPVASHDFITSTLYYLWAWAEGRVDSTPNGPVWHDEKAHQTWINYGGREHSGDVDSDLVSLD